MTTSIDMIMARVLSGDKSILDEKLVISKFRGKHSFLSNMYECNVPFSGLTFPSAEHAFVAAKTTNIMHRKHISNIKISPAAKKYGKCLELRENWDNIKSTIMLEILLSKFITNPNLKDELLATENTTFM